MTEQRKNIKLSRLFSIVALCAFLVGAAIGVFATLHFTKSQTTKTLQIEEVYEPSTEEIPDSNPMDPPKNEKDSLKRYKEMLQNSLENSIQNEVNEITYYGVLIGEYSKSDQANNLAIDLKDQYDWNIAVYPIKNLHHVIVGPFDNKEDAQNFLNQIPQQARFIKSKVILFPKNN